MHADFEHVATPPEQSWAYREFRQRAFDFTWHLHSRLELTLITRGTGTRIVGTIGYPVACSPQAWASGTIFHLVQTMLGIEPSDGEPRLAPISQGPWLQLSGVRIGDWQGDIDSRTNATS